MFVGSVGPNQVHDFNPGIKKSGLFWTIRVPESAASIRLGDRTARFQMNNLAIPDDHDFLNSVGVEVPPIPLIPSFVSFDVRWTAKSGVWTAYTGAGSTDLGVHVA